jgi:hypothetical protein
LKNNQNLETGKTSIAEIPVPKAYSKPQLKEYGMMQKITLGGSPGTGDSGNSNTEKSPA